MEHEQYMRRCLQLAKLGAGYTAPNPMVGAVLVHEGVIIGEGWHRAFGGPHAEVNCLNSVALRFLELIPNSTLYVSLEPCAHFGKTPPCANLIIQHNIKRVVVGCRDPFGLVNGKGIELLIAAGIDCTVGVLQEACRRMNRRFFTFHEKKRPYIHLKWAQSADGFIAAAAEGPEVQRTFISNAFSNRLVHKMRSREAAIVVGTNTALLDNPRLDLRLWKGKSPLRLVIDRKLKLSPNHHLLNDQQPVICFNVIKEEQKGAVTYLKLADQSNLLPQMLERLWLLNIQSVLVEGGARLLQEFIDQDIWDEATVITSEQLLVEKGVKCPILKNTSETVHFKLENDRIVRYANGIL